MAERQRRPDLNERFSLPEDTDPDEALKRLLGVVEPDEAEGVSGETEDEEPES
jgi:hypothetical protein